MYVCLKGMDISKMNKRKLTCQEIFSFMKKILNYRDTGSDEWPR